jgi:hypothetical protein
MKLLVVLLGLLVSTPALASDDCAEQRRKNPKAACTLEIEAEKLEGQTVGPAGERLGGRREAARGELIRYRTDWNDRLIQATLRL